MLLPDANGRFHALAVLGMAVLATMATLLTFGPGSAQVGNGGKPALTDLVIDQRVEVPLYRNGTVIGRAVIPLGT